MLVARWSNKIWYGQSASEGAIKHGAVAEYCSSESAETVTLQHIKEKTGGLASLYNWTRQEAGKRHKIIDLGGYLTSQGSAESPI